MPVDLRSLWKCQSKSVEVQKGVTVDVRALRASELDACRAAFKYPKAKLVRDPNKGSDAPSIIDESDPEYRAAKREYSESVAAAAVAVAVDADVKCEKPAMSSEWLVAAAKYVRESLSAGAIDRIMEAVEELSDPAALRKEAAGNS